MNHAVRAKSLIGIRFRPQGRSIESGLDCIGVAVISYALDAALVPSDYRLRSADKPRLLAGLNRYFRPISCKRAEAGDLLLCAAADQLHLAVKTDDGFVHADAGLRRVVETPGCPPWPILKAFRRQLRAIKD